MYILGEYDHGRLPIMDQYNILDYSMLNLVGGGEVIAIEGETDRQTEQGDQCREGWGGRGGRKGV